MFDMEKCGRTISEARKKKNMTQMELADRMGISFQAVSNWERGVSMPDISKLLELSEVLGITVDEILGKPSPLIETLVQSEKEAAQAAPADAPTESAESAAAPAKEEKQADTELLADLPKLLDNVKDLLNNKLTNALEKSKTIPTEVLGSLPKITLEEFKEAVPLLKPTQVDEVADTFDFDFDLDEIEDLLPFLGRETCEKIFIKACAEADMDAMETIAPFVSRECIDAELIRLAKKGEDVEDLMPFASKEACAEIGWELYQNDGVDAVEDLAPFMPKEILEKIAQDAVKEYGLEEIEDIAPFLSKEFLQELAKESIEKYGIGSIGGIAPYLGRDFLVNLLQEKFK